MKLYNLFLIFILLVFLSGCTDNNQVNTDKTGKEVSTSENKVDEKPVTAVSTVKKDLKLVLDSAIDYSADYAIISKGETSNAKMVYDLPRFAILTTSSDGDIKMIFDGKSIITCSDMENSWTCYKMTAETPESVKISEDIKSGASKITEIGTCLRAGETGIKYDVDSIGAKSTICYTNDGILLEMKNNDTEMFAINVLRGISESDFTPPATPKDISSMIPGGLPTQ